MQYFAGMLAFGYEQAGDYEKAEAVALRGLDTCDDDVWLKHSYAHALYFQGPNKLKIGLAFLKKTCQSLSRDKTMDFLFSHVHWHRALLHVENREFVEAVEIFHKVLWIDSDSDYKDDVQVQINALELLWKLECAGFDVDKEWKEVVDVSIRRLGR